VKRKPRAHRLSAKWAQELPRAAQDHAWFWAIGVQRQHERLKQGDDRYGEGGALLDAIQYVICLRNLIRAAHLVQDALHPYGDNYVRYWLRHLHEQAPGVVTARNFLEHFDDYALGLGQVRAGRFRTPLRVKVDKSREDSWKIVLVASGRRIAIDLDRATEAAAQLCIGLEIAQDVADEMRDMPEPWSAEWMAMQREIHKDDPDYYRRPRLLPREQDPGTTVSGP
jgi:hypothetical protein